MHGSKQRGDHSIGEYRVRQMETAVGARMISRIQHRSKASLHMTKDRRVAFVLAACLFVRLAAYFNPARFNMPPSPAHYREILDCLPVLARRSYEELVPILCLQE